MTRAVRVAAILAPALALAACNILAPASYILGGLPKTDAVYELPVEKKGTSKFVVYVDDSNSVIPTNARAVRLAVADRVTGELIDRDIVPADRMINPRDGMGVVSRRDSRTEPMSVVGIARAVGADIIIYIDMKSFQLRVDGTTLQPTATCNVRVTDAANNLRLFPEDDGTGTSVWPVSVQLDLRGVDPMASRSRSNQTLLNEALANELGDDITKMFYKHDARPLGDGLDGG